MRQNIKEGSTQGALSDKVISRAIGEQIWRTREEAQLSRLQLAERLPSGIGDRTLLSYEHGTRHLTVLRWIEISHALEADAPRLLALGLQRARIHLENMALVVDLRMLLQEQNDKFRPMLQWAQNALNVHPGGIVEVEPAVVRNLALFIGCDYMDLATYLARLAPDGCRQHTTAADHPTR